MGLSLKKIVRGAGKLLKSPAGLGAVTAAFPVLAPFAGAYATARAALGEDADGGGGDGGMIPTAGGPVTGAVMGAGALAMMSPIVRQAIIKLVQSIGGRGGTIVAYGRRVWEAITGWVARNPGTSAISMLVGLGLTVEEAAHFLAWGATIKRKRRRRGISARDLRITRRTTRKLITMTHQLRELCVSAPFARRGRSRTIQGATVTRLG